MASKFLPEWVVGLNKPTPLIGQQLDNTNRPCKCNVRPECCATPRETLREGAIHQSSYIGSQKQNISKYSGGDALLHQTHNISRLSASFQPFFNHPNNHGLTASHLPKACGCQLPTSQNRPAGGQWPFPALPTPPFAFGFCSSNVSTLAASIPLAFFPSSLANTPPLAEQACLGTYAETHPSVWGSVLVDNSPAHKCGEQPFNVAANRLPRSSQRNKKRRTRRMTYTEKALK